MTTKMSTFGIQQNFVPIKINDSTAVKLDMICQTYPRALPELVYSLDFVFLGDIASFYSCTNSYADIVPCFCQVPYSY